MPVAPAPSLPSRYSQYVLDCQSPHQRFQLIQTSQANLTLVNDKIGVVDVS